MSLCSTMPFSTLSTSFLSLGFIRSFQQLPRSENPSIPLRMTHKSLAGDLLWPQTHRPPFPEGSPGTKPSCGHRCHQPERDKDQHRVTSSLGPSHRGLVSCGNQTGESLIFNFPDPAHRDTGPDQLVNDCGVFKNSLVSRHPQNSADD